MKILMINVVCGMRSTGRICTDLASSLEEQGHEVKIAYGRENVPDKYQKYAVRIGSDFDVKLHGVKARIFDQSGFGSKKATENFIKWVKEFDPDIIHLHNIHGYYINIEVLFKYLRSCGKRILWTLHDCWAFTGHAAYCEFAHCERWINGCYDCPNTREYPTSYSDNSDINWKRKKELFEGIPNLLIITPSEWLSELARKSFLGKYQIMTINNGIDTSVFRPIHSDVKNKMGLSNKKIVLGVAALWEKRKGMEDFLKLADLLDDEYQIVLVGLSKDQISKLPSKIIGIERTNSVQELVDLYNSAEVYVNPTYEDNYPTTNLEAIACGIPVISYDTGGSSESACMYGYVVEKGNVNELKQQIERINELSKKIPDVGIGRFIREYNSVYFSKGNYK